MKKNLIVIFTLFLFSSAFSQITTSSIEGFVRSEEGKKVASAKIVLVYTPTNTTFRTVANKDGYYSINNLQPGGPYILTASSVGFKENALNDLNLLLGENSGVDINLSVESNSLKEVTISTGKKKANSALQIDAARIRVLPTTSRNITDMTRLTPQSANNSFLGTNYRYNNVTIDGSISNDAIGFSPSLGGQSGTSGMPGSSTRTASISMDAIQDIQVYLSPYDVKIGNFLGGSINAVTRSGSNEVNGSVYLFGRNGGMTGNNNAGDGSKIPTSFHEYQLGARIGLPIVKDKLFYFSNLEYSERVDPVFYAAGTGTGASKSLISEAEAQTISSVLSSKYGFNTGDYGQYNIQSKGWKLFNRFDWKINEKHTLTLRNNTTISQASNLERDAANFRFGSMDFMQYNIQSGTVAELKSKLSDRITNNFVLGFTNIHDWRNPMSSNSSIPQIEISMNGGTVFAGNDREATVFNMLQRSWEITNNVNIAVGKDKKHNVTIGTHNELYHIDYGFVNALNGRVSYSSLANFQAGLASRVRGFYDSDPTQNNVAYQFQNPYAGFNVNMFSLYGQDEWQINDKLRITYGLRGDVTVLPNKPAVSAQAAATNIDKSAGSSFAATPLKNITNDFMGQLLLSPRFGFNYDVMGDKKVVIKGGTGIFTGRIPFAWLGYAYYNDGVGYGSYDKNGGITAAMGDPIALGASNWASKNGIGVNATTGLPSQVQVDAINNNFQLPQVWRSNLGVDFNLSGYQFGVEAIYTKVIKDLMFQQVNFADTFAYMSYDPNHQMPYYITNGSQGSKLNTALSNAYMLSNTDQGYRYSVTAKIAKAYKMGLNFSAAYTYGESKDVTNGIRNSMESNWQLNPTLIPNNPSLAYSNFDIRHRIVSTLGYKRSWDKANTSSINFVFTAQSGNPFSWGFQNTKIDNTPVNTGLAYIFKDEAEASKYFVANGTVTAAQQAADFMAFVNADPYLSSRKGQFTERNAARTPWNVNLDVRMMHEFKLNNEKKNSIQITFDIINLTNLLNPNWGWSYFVPNTFNSMASLGLAQKSATLSATDVNPTYTFSTPASPYSIDQMASRWQMQVGLRYNF